MRVRADFGGTTGTAPDRRGEKDHGFIRIAEASLTVPAEPAAE